MSYAHRTYIRINLGQKLNVTKYTVKLLTSEKWANLNVLKDTKVRNAIRVKLDYKIDVGKYTTVSNYIRVKVGQIHVLNIKVTGYHLEYIAFVSLEIGIEKMQLHFSHILVYITKV